MTTIRGKGFLFGKFCKVKIKKWSGFLIRKIKNKKYTDFVPCVYNAFVYKNTVGLFCKEERIFFIEHLLGAWYLAGMPNLIVEVEGDELPFLDGSGKEYYLIFKEFKERRKPVKLKNEFFFKRGKTLIYYSPCEELKIHGIFYYFPFVFYATYQSGSEHRIAEAKTFGWRINKIENLQHLNFKIKLSNNFVYSPPVKKNEFARHKILDFLGDLALSGIRLKGSFKIFFTSHWSNHHFVKKILNMILL